MRTKLMTCTRIISCIRLIFVIGLIGVNVGVISAQTKIAVLIAQDSTFTHLFLGQTLSDNQNRSYNLDLRAYWLKALAERSGNQYEMIQVEPEGEMRGSMLDMKRNADWIDYFVETGYDGVIVIGEDMYYGGNSMYRPPHPGNPTGPYLNVSSHGSYTSDNYDPEMLIIFCTPKIAVYDSKGNRLKQIERVETTMLMKRKIPVSQPDRLTSDELLEAGNRVQKLIDLYAAEVVYTLGELK